MASIFDRVKDFFGFWDNNQQQNTQPTQDAGTFWGSVNNNIQQPIIQAPVENNQPSSFIDWVKNTVNDAATETAVFLWWLFWKDEERIRENAKKESFTQYLDNNDWWLSEFVSWWVDLFKDIWKYVWDAVVDEYKSTPTSIFNPLTPIIWVAKKVWSDIWNSDIVKEARIWTDDLFTNDEEEINKKRVDNTIANSLQQFQYTSDYVTKWENSLDFSNNNYAFTTWWPVVSSQKNDVEKDMSSVMAATSTKIDWKQDFAQYKDNDKWYEQKFNELSSWSDKSINEAAINLSFEHWVAIEDITAELKQERLKVINAAFWESKKEQLTDEDASIITNMAWKYVTYRENQNEAYKAYEDKKTESYYKQYFPETWEQKMQEKKDIEKRQEEFYNTWVDSIPTFAKFVWDKLSDINTSQTDKNILRKNLNTAINWVATLKLQNYQFIKELEWYENDAWLGKNFSQQIKQKFDEYEKNKIYYIEQSALNFASNQDNDTSKTTTDYNYIKDRVLWTVDSYTFEWKTYTKQELQSIADWTYVWNNSDNASLAARLVADHMTKPLRTVTDFDWKQREIKLEQYWNLGMQGINYMESQIKDIILSKTKNSYRWAWYFATQWISYWLWFIAQTVENTVAWWLRQVWDISIDENNRSNSLWNLAKDFISSPLWIEWALWNKTTLSILWESNELVFDKAWWNLSEWYDNVTNFTDEYWEWIVDIATLWSPLWAWWAAAKTLSLTRMWNVIKWIWEASKAARYITMWEKIIWMWDALIKTSEVIKWSRFANFIRWFWWLKSITKESMLANSFAEWIEDWVKYEKYIDSLWRASSRFDNLWEFGKELLDNVLQDRLIWNFIVWKTNSQYSDDDVFWDSVLTLWAIPVIRWVTWIIRGTEWFARTFKQNQEFNKIIWNIWKDYSSIENTLPNVLESFWIKKWVDFELTPQGKIIPKSVDAYDKIFDAQQIHAISWATLTRLAIESPEIAEVAIADALLKNDALSTIRKNTSNISRTNINASEYLKMLWDEAKAMYDWWAASTVFSKYMWFAKDQINVVKSINSMTVIWNWEAMFRTTNKWDIKTAMWFTDEQLDAWLTEEIIKQKSDEIWVDLKNIFSKTEVKNQDWWTSVVYKYGWQSDIEVGLSAVKWNELEELISKLPVESQKNVKVVEKLLWDLESNIPC